MLYRLFYVVYFAYFIYMIAVAVAGVLLRDVSLMIIGGFLLLLFGAFSALVVLDMMRIVPRQ